MRNLKNWAAAAAMLALTGAAQADLFDRGGGMIYDSTLNITWLADWNYAKTQFAATGGAQGDADGLMEWTTASNWANDLVHGGYSDWRLPTALNAEGSGPCYGFDCAGSEMGHMFYVDLGATAGSNFSTGTNTTNLALFENVQSNLYVRASGSEAKLWMEPQVRVAGSQGFDAGTLRELVQVAQSNSELIERAWHDYFG